jgi:hypothetical protein
MIRSSTFLAATSFAVLLAGGSARADYLYNWDPDVPKVFSDHSGMQVDLTNGKTVGPVSGNQNMAVTVLSTLINPGVTGSDTFTQNNTTGLKLTITDGTQNGSVDFGLRITGSLSAEHSNLTYTFLDGTTKTLTVDGHAYTVSVDQASGSVPGSIGAKILVGTTAGGTTAGGTTAGGTTAAASTAGGTTGGGTTGGGTTGSSGGTGQASAPEPSSVALAGLGAALVALSRWRKGRRTKDVPQTAA